MFCKDFGTYSCKLLSVLEYTTKSSPSHIITSYPLSINSNAKSLANIRFLASLERTSFVSLVCTTFIFYTLFLSHESTITDIVRKLSTTTKISSSKSMKLKLVTIISLTSDRISYTSFNVASYI